MVDLIKENFEIIVVVAFILVLILLAIVLSFNYYLTKAFSNKKFHVISSFEIDALKNTKTFVINIHNKGINDIRISGFGFIYKGQTIDFYKRYIVDNALPLDFKIVISSRDFITTFIQESALKPIISDINRGRVRISCLKVYVRDYLGLSTFSKASQIRKQLGKLLRNDKNQIIENKRQQKQKLMEEKKNYRQKKRVENSIKRKEILGKILFKTRAFFNKFKKKNKKPLN